MYKTKQQDGNKRQLKEGVKQISNKTHNTWKECEKTEKIEIHLFQTYTINLKQRK